MTTAKKKTPAPIKQNPNAIAIMKDEGKSEKRQFAEIGLSARLYRAL